MFSRKAHSHRALIVAIVLASSGVATIAEAQTTRRNARQVPAAPVNLVRGDADLFAATLAGRYAQGTDDPALAAQAWSRAFARQTGDRELMARAINANIQAGDVAQAVRIAKMAQPQARNEEAALVLAIDAFAQGRYIEVTRALAGQMFQPSQQIFVDHLNGYALLGQNKREDGVNVSARATGISALDKATLVSRALILDQAGRNDEAGILFKSALDSNVKWPVGMRAYANWLIRNNRKPDAVDLYQRLIRAGGPDVGSFTSNLAQIERTTSAPTAPDLRATASVGLLTIAQSLAAEGRGGAPEILLNLVAYLDPRSDGAALALAEQLIDDDKGKRALPILTRLTPSSPDYLAARRELVWLTFQTDKVRGVALARETLRAQPSEIAAQRLLADILAANGDNQEAETLYSALIDASKAAGQTEQDSWPLYFGRGGARERQGKWTQALIDLRIAKAAAPNQPTVLNYLGFALADRDESLDEALTMLRTAVRLRPRSAAVMDSLGWVHFKAGRYEEAVATLETAAGMDSSIAEISDHLGDAYWRSGRQDEARMEWQRTLRLELTDKQKEAVRAKLRDGLPDDPNVRARRAVAAQSGAPNRQ